MSYVLDASVAAKWFNLEELSDKATEIKEAYVEGQIQLFAPTHMIYEVGNSIWRNTQLTDKDAANAITSLLRLRLDLLEPNEERTRRTMEIAKSRKTTFYDATYSQAAEELNTVLLTADETQLLAAKGIAKVIHIREAK